MPHFDWSLNLKDTRTGKDIKMMHKDSACFYSLASYRNGLFTHLPIKEQNKIAKLEGHAWNKAHILSTKPIVPVFVEYNLYVHKFLKDKPDVVREYISFLMHKMRGVLTKNVDTILEDGVRVSCRIPHTNMMQTLIAFRYLEESPYYELIPMWYNLVHIYHLDPSFAFVVAHVRLSQFSGHTIMTSERLPKNGVHEWVIQKKAPLDIKEPPFTQHARYRVYDYWENIKKNKGTSFSNFINGTPLNKLKEKEELFLNAEYK